MSLLFDETQEAIGREAEKIVSTLADNATRLAAVEEIGSLETSLHEIAIGQGWYGMAVEEEYGGLGLDLATAGIVASKYGAIAHGLPFLNSNFGFTQGLQLSSAENLKIEYLPQITDGTKIGTFAFSESQDVLPNQSSLLLSGGKLNGKKPAVLSGLKADFAIVLALENNSPVLVFVDLDQTAVSKSPIQSYDNARLLADIELNSAVCEIIAKGQDALDIARNTLARLAVLYAFEQLGGAEAMMRLARNYATERKAFGQKIGAFQSVKHRITELYALVELARANAIDATARIDSDFLLAASAARLSATEAYDTATRDCMQIHGAIGVTWEIGIHLHLRRARSLANEIGNSFYWEDVLVSELEKSNSFGAVQ